MSTEVVLSVKEISPEKNNEKKCSSHTTIPTIDAIQIPKEPAPLKNLYQFIKEMSRPQSAPEFIASQYLNLYPKETKFTVNAKEVQKFLPNINIKSEKKLLTLFGVTPTNSTDPNNPKESLYYFQPNQYILATMINSASYPEIEERINFAFQMYDIDNDGKIGKADLKEMFSIYGQENQFRMDEKTIGDLVDVIYNEIGKNKNDLITLDEFEGFFKTYMKQSVKVQVFERRKTKMTALNPKDIDIKVHESDNNELRESRISKQNQKNTKMDRAWSAFKSKFYVDGAKWIWLALWITGLLYFFISTFVTFYKKTDTVAAGVAKGSAAVVNYNIAIMIALVTRSLTTILRKIRVATLLPLNFNIYFHTILGYTTLAAAWVHSLAHLTSFMRTLANMPNLETLNSLLATPLDEVKPYRWWAIQSVPGITGIIALVLMTMMVVFAIKKARQKNFERFWYTHVLWLVIVIVLAFHGISKYLGSPKFYLWAGFPSLVLLVEKIFALIIHLLTRHKIISIEYLDSGVVEMRITKPPSFKFIPGQYARLKIPEISLLQWHPFSFSSSQSDDYISFHISPVGDWTNQLKQIALDLKTKKLLKVPTIFLLGPYGAPSQHYSNFKDIMIISSGVGATPFASIMKDLSYRAKENSENINTKSVDFYWVNRRPSTHKWLTNLFKELQNHEASKSLVKIHMFFTSPHSKYDVRSLLLWRGLEILHNAGREIKGLEYFDFMFWGRPDWDFIFQQKAKEVGKGTVGVFFCGNNFLAKELHQKCLKYSENVVFKFYKEIF